MELGEQLAAKGLTLPAPTSPEIDHFNGEDPEKWNALCQKRSDDALTQKTKDRKRTDEAYEFVEGNPYDLSGSVTAEKRWFFRQAKVLISELIATVLENGFDVEVKADPPPSIDDPEYIQTVAEYAQKFGLQAEDHGRAASELLTHGLATIDEKNHVEVLHQRFAEHALIDGPGAVYSYVGVSPYSPNVVVDELVPADQIWLDVNANDFYEKEWMRRDWPITLERLIAKFPEHEAYFKEHQGAGKDAAKVKKEASQFDHDYLQEHYFRNWEMDDDGTGYQVPKYPGHWMQVWRYGNKVLRIKPLPFLHEDCPYDQLLGVTKMRGPQGMSFALDILYGPVMAKNRSLNTALTTAEKQGSGKRLIDTGALVEPNDIYDDSLSNIPVMPGYSLDQVVKDLIGPDIAPSVKAILDLMQREVPQLVGSAPEPGTVPNDTGDAAKAGRSQATFRTRFRDFIARRAAKKVSNLIQFDDKERAWKTMGGVGPPIVRYWAGIFTPVIDNLEAYFSIVVSDKKQLAIDPVKQAEITERMIKLAQEAAQNPLAPIPYSQALEMGPDFEGKDRMVRVARISEAQQKKAAEEAKASGQPDPAQKQIQARNAVERGQGGVEIVKKAWQAKADNPINADIVLDAVRAGVVENDFKIAQGEAQTIDPAQAAQEIGGAPDPTVTPDAPQPEPLPMEQGLTQ